MTNFDMRKCSCGHFAFLHSFRERMSAEVAAVLGPDHGSCVACPASIARGGCPQFTERSPDAYTKSDIMVHSQPGLHADPCGPACARLNGAAHTHGERATYHYRSDLPICPHDGIGGLLPCPLLPACSEKCGINGSRPLKGAEVMTTTTPESRGAIAYTAFLRGQNLTQAEMQNSPMFDQLPEQERQGWIRAANVLWSLAKTGQAIL